MRAVAHSPSSLKRMSPTIVLNALLACELVVVEAAGRLDCLLQYLHRGIGEGRLVEAERVGAGLLGLRLVRLQERLDAGEMHFGARHIEMVVHDAVELFAQLLHEATRIAFRPLLHRTIASS